MTSVRTIRTGSGICGYVVEEEEPRGVWRRKGREVVWRGKGRGVVYSG